MKSIQEKNVPKTDITRYLALFGNSWVFALILTLFLYLRPTPYGLNYVMDLQRYLSYAISYMTFGLMIVVVPYLIISLFIIPKKHPRLAIGLEITCTTFLSLMLLYQQVDSEVLRFCGMHITPDFWRTYVLTQGVPDVLWDLLATDAGGAYLSLILLLVPLLFIVSWCVLRCRILNKSFLRYGGVFWASICIMSVCVIFFSKTKLYKLAPPPVLLYVNFISNPYEYRFSDEIVSHLEYERKAWLEQENDKAWEANDPNRPWLHNHRGECTVPDKKYNIITIVFETYRAYNLNLFNPKYPMVIAPYLNSLLTGDNVAYYTHYYTNGHPTINAFMSLHTSVLQHLTRTAANYYSHESIDSYINILRRHGWYSVFVAGADPDWDNQRPWLIRWYDEILYNANNKEQDRLVMHSALQWLNHYDHSKPFAMTVFLISNHIPFRLHEENLRLTDSEVLNDKIINTMHYDDDVLREFVESIRKESWFDDTILVITGDHGLDLGERGDPPNYYNMRTEAVWVPLVIYGKHPRLPRGSQDIIASHVDLGPTMLDLLGICDNINAVGHSLLTKNEEKAEIYIQKGWRSVIRNKDWSSYVIFDPYGAEDQVFLYRGDDYLQLNDVAKEYPDIARKMHERSKIITETTNFCYTYNRFGSANSM